MFKEPKITTVPTVFVVIKNETESKSYTLNEYEFTNLRLEYAKGLWKGYSIFTLFKHKNENVSGYIGYNGACHPMLPPQFAVIDKLHLDIFSMKFEKEPAHWEKGKVKDAALEEQRRKKEEKDQKAYEKHLRSL